MTMRIIISIMIWIASTILTMLVFFVSLFLRIMLFFFDKQGKIVHAQCFWWSDAILALNPYWKFEVRGLENIDYHRTYVMVANHESLADIVVMYKTRMQFKWVAKRSLLKVPFIGGVLWVGNHILLSRGEFGSIKKVYHEAAVWLRAGMSVLFFPEGTRSDTDEMKAFQNGAFKLAIKEKKPILPIRIRGTGNVIPRGSWILNEKMFCSLTVLPPIDTTDFEIGDFARLRDMTRERLAAVSK